MEKEKDKPMLLMTGEVKTMKEYEKIKASFEELCETACGYASEYNDYMLFSMAGDIIDQWLITHELDEEKKEALYKCLKAALARTIELTHICAFWPKNGSEAISCDKAKPEELKLFSDTLGAMIEEMNGAKDSYAQYNAQVLEDMKILVEDYLTPSAEELMQVC